MAIQGKGNKYFLSESFYLEPSVVIVNKVRNNSCKRSCIFKNDFNNVTIKFDRLINTCENMFKGLKNLIEIDLSNLDTSKVTNMSSMFDQCINLKKINFGNINTSLVNNMEYLFHNCSKLASIDVSKFDTSSVTNFRYLFSECRSLTSIDVTNFNTQNVVDMQDFFAACHSLTSVDLTNFNTSKITNMRGIFYQCYKRKRLDLRNFNTFLVTNFYVMFFASKALVYINIYSFEIQRENVNINDIFAYTPPNIKICINDDKTKNLLTPKSPEKIFNCSDICFNENIKIDLKRNICLDNCSQSEYKYEYDNYCYDICPNTTYVSNNNEYLCLDKSKEDIYIFDENKKVYKECYNTCKKCNKEGDEINNNCIECKDGFIFLNDSINDTNCYIICKYYYYFDEYNKYACTVNQECPSKYNKLIKEKNKCIGDCSKDNIYRYEYDDICYKNYQFSTNNINYTLLENEVLKEDKNIQVLQEYIMNSDIIENIIKGNDDYIQQEDDITYQITTSDNQKNNSNSNISSIHLGECENTLRQKYDINETLPLIILKIDVKYPGALIPIIGYEVYHPINKTKLDLSDCEDIKLNN